MKTSLITLVLVCASSSGKAGDAPKSSDQANIQGVWLAQSESQNGHKKNVTYQYVFRGDKLTFKDETGKGMKYSFKLETASNLKLVTIRPEETPTNSTPVSVAYESNGDSLKIVVAPPGFAPHRNIRQEQSGVDYLQAKEPMKTPNHALERTRPESIGSTIADRSSRSVTSRQSSSSRRTIGNVRLTPQRSDSHKTVSGNRGAVQNDHRSSV
jgi:uncharacterized protein (TIGR03067 family)